MPFCNCKARLAGYQRTRADRLRHERDAGRYHAARPLGHQPRAHPARHGSLTVPRHRGLLPAAQPVPDGQPDHQGCGLYPGASVPFHEVTGRRDPRSRLVCEP